jgi:hypothetical protein
VGDKMVVEVPSIKLSQREIKQLNETIILMEGLLTTPPTAKCRAMKKMRRIL